MFCSLVAFFSLCSPAILKADTGELWDSSVFPDLSVNSFPMLHGMTLVWQAKGGLAGSTSGTADWEVFLCDLKTLTVIQLTDDDSDDILPKTDGDYVVWQKHVHGRGNRIFLYRISGGSPVGGREISLADNGDNFAPEVANGRVVWASQLVAVSYEPARIMLYDAANQSGPMVISDPAMDCGTPHINTQYVLWTQETSDGAVTHWIYDLNADFSAARPAPEKFDWEHSPSSEGRQNVLARSDGTDREIFLFSLSGGYSRITDNSRDDLSPVISQNHIAWISEGEVHVAEIARFMRVVGLGASAVWADGFKAEWEALGGGVDEYRIDLATDPQFMSLVPGYDDKPVGNVSWVDIFGLAKDKTYYYRVRAIINGALTADSATARVSLATIPKGDMSGRFRSLSSIYHLLLH